jgi:hypothetical protein
MGFKIEEKRSTYDVYREVVKVVKPSNLRSRSTQTLGLKEKLQEMERRLLETPSTPYTSYKGARAVYTTMRFVDQLSIVVEVILRLRV